MTLEEKIREFNKKAKSEILRIGFPEEQITRIPFSSPSLNYITHGGIPRNRLVEFSGEENSGKSTLSLDIIANAQRLFAEEAGEDGEPKKVLLVDAENSHTTEWLESFGINADELLLAQPEDSSAEDLFQMTRELIQTGEIGLVVFDSFGVVHSDQAFSKTIGEKTYGGIAQPLTTFSKFLIQDCKKYDCTFIGINQIRENLASPYGGKKTVGGLGWGFNCTLRLEISKDAYIDDKGNEVAKSYAYPIGQISKVFIKKSKGFSPNRRLGRFSVNFGEGIDVIRDTIETGIFTNQIEKSGSWLTVIDSDTGEIVTKEQGFSKLKLFFSENTEIFENFHEQVNKKLMEEE